MQIDVKHVLRAFGVTISNSQKEGWERGKQKFQMNEVKPCKLIPLRLSKPVLLQLSLFLKVSAPLQIKLIV